MPDKPATPSEKFFVLEEQYKRLGKSWDPDLTKQVLIDGYMADHGWPANHPQLEQLRRIQSEPIEADPARVRRQKISDREIQREEQAAKERAARLAAERAESARTPLELEAENERLRQLIEARDSRTIEPPAQDDDDEDLPESEDDFPRWEMAQWTKKRILEWADDHGLEVPKELRSFRAKADIVEWILQAAEAAEQE